MTTPVETPPSAEAPASSATFWRVCWVLALSAAGVLWAHAPWSAAGETNTNVARAWPHLKVLRVELQRELDYGDQQFTDVVDAVFNDQALTNVDGFDQVHRNLRALEGLIDVRKQVRLEHAERWRNELRKHYSPGKGLDTALASLNSSSEMERMAFVPVEAALRKAIASERDYLSIAGSAAERIDKLGGSQAAYNMVRDQAAVAANQFMADVRSFDEEHARYVSVLDAHMRKAEKMFPILDALSKE